MHLHKLKVESFFLVANLSQLDLQLFIVREVHLNIDVTANAHIPEQRSKSLQKLDQILIWYAVHQHLVQSLDHILRNFLLDFAKDATI